MAKINMKGLQREIASQYSVKFKRAIVSRIKADVEKVKRQMLLEFSSHKVTQDLEGGSPSANFARGGSLFSFIGFSSGDAPTNAIRAILISSLRVSVTRVLRNEVSVDFRVDIPSMSEIESVTPLPWAPGMSWVREIETGITGLGQYLVKDSPASRSGKAIQIKGNMRSGEMGGISYMTQIIGNLIKNLTNTLDSR
jgi:hypothetical protein